MSSETLEDFLCRCEFAIESLEYGESQDAYITIVDLYRELAALSGKHA